MARTNKGPAWRLFPLAGAMTFLAGATDVYGLGYLHDLFVSFMSGNTTMLGVALGSADWARAAMIAALIGLFVAGAAAGEVLAIVAGNWHIAAVAMATAIVLAVPVIQPGWSAEAFVFAMGALNASVTRVGTVSVSLTYVTGSLVRFGQGLGKALCGRSGDWSWMSQAPMWLSLLTGCVLATVMRQGLGSDTLWPLPLLALVISVAALGFGRD